MRCRLLFSLDIEKSIQAANGFPMITNEIMSQDPSPAYSHPKTLIEMWITCLDPISANSEKGRGSEWALRVGQRLPSRFGQSGAARELNLVQIVVEAPAIRGGLPST